MNNILSFDFHKLLSFKYLTVTPPSTFRFFIPITILLLILFIVWLVFLYIYLFCTDNISPKFRYLKKLSWFSFFFSLILAFLLYARRIFLGIYTRLDIILVLLILFFVILYFLYYFLFRLEKETVAYYREITKKKYMPRKLKKRK